ncbi:MAG: hypothetical protein EXR95_07550 [Gemmatimonadetes bacterium]|nr:hypothetical protein [Gemmatimonadota bacterium]
MPDDPQGSFQDGQRTRPESQGSNGAGTGPRELDRLPPPAFPPGQRGAPPVRARRPADARLTGSEGAGGEEEGVPDDAFISPDEPIVRSGSRIAAGAFISPDDPMRAREDMDAEDAVATGIGDDPHLGQEDLALARHADPHVADLVVRVGRLADSLRDLGEAGLRVTPDMGRFDATLRAYCVGYLAAQRETRSE